jgi:hypothetical protein
MNPEQQTYRRVHYLIRQIVELERSQIQARNDLRYLERNMASRGWHELQAAEQRVENGYEQLERCKTERDALLTQLPFRLLLQACANSVPDEVYVEATAVAYRTYNRAVEARLRPAFLFCNYAVRSPTYVQSTLEEAQTTLAPLMDEWLAFSQDPEHRRAFINYTPAQIATLHARFEAALRALETDFSTTILRASQRTLDRGMTRLPPSVLSQIATRTLRR